MENANTPSIGIPEGDAKQAINIQSIGIPEDDAKQAINIQSIGIPEDDAKQAINIQSIGRSQSELGQSRQPIFPNIAFRNIVYTGYYKAGYRARLGT
jgi:hypothetical protein